MSLSAATPPRAPDLSGRALDGRYELLAVIGEGTFGRVYRGRDRRLARPVAVKVIKPWWAEDPHWVRSFEREAQLMASVNDPRIVQIFDVGDTEEGLYYVAELVQGESLATRLRRGPLRPGAAASVAEELCRALGSAHAARVVHGDIKPGNVLIPSSGEIKVTDFGVARLLGGSSDEATDVGGTPFYMAPEQARGRGISPATDVYGAGVVLYEMLAGHRPFSGGSAVELALRHLQELPPSLPPGTPRALRLVVARALAKDPDERYRTASEMAQALAAARGAAGTRPPAGASRPVRVHPRPRPGAVARTQVAPWRSPRRNLNPAARRRTIAAFVLVVGLLAAMAAGAILAGGAARVRVPNLRGLRAARIRTTLSRDHLRLAFRSRYSSASRGTAVAQTPAPGRRIDEGSRVIATLSAGPPPVAVPRVLGFSSADAQSSLRQLGLHARVEAVPAPGVAAGTVTGQSPAAGIERLPGSTVSLSVAETPRWRTVLTFNDRGGRASPGFHIRGRRWRLVYSMAYSGMCTFIFFCSGPSARVTDLGHGTTVGGFGLAEGDHQVRMFSSGPGSYQVTIRPGDDSAHWSAEVQDYY